MKYKVGDKFLQEIEIVEISENASFPYVTEKLERTIFNERELDKMRRSDDMTAEEAWEIARKIYMDPERGGFTDDELQEIFDGICCITEIFIEYSPTASQGQNRGLGSQRETD